MNNERHYIRELPIDFPWRLIEDITNGFAVEQKIGSGGYGVVYKGVHPNGQELAVKKLHNMPGLDEDQFQNELRILSRIFHQNIVQLVGKSYIEQDRCVEHQGRLVFATKIDRVICLEFLPKGSLEKHLSDERSGLPWHSRYKIIKGISDGLKYLHGERIFHLDLKPSNVLLDKDMVPKIADFGLSRLFSGTRQSHTTKNLLCTLGYAPPEFVDMGKITSKFDVFSLGVIIIKVLAGPDGYSTYSDMSDSQDFIDLVQGNWREMLQEAGLKDVYLDAYCNQVKTCTEIALNCVESSSHKRPSIEDIITMLNETEETIDKLYRRLFIVQPLNLCFPFEPNKLIPCPLHLTNDADHDISFRIQINTPDIFAGLLRGCVPARSTGTYILTMQKQKKPPPNLVTTIHILSVVGTIIESFDEAEVVHEQRKVVKITCHYECASQLASKVLALNPTYNIDLFPQWKPWVRITSGETLGTEIWNYKTRCNRTSSQESGARKRGADWGAVSGSWAKTPSVNNWWEDMSSPGCPEEVFRRAFRMSRATFDAICKELDAVAVSNLPSGTMPMRQRVAICIWSLATGEPHRLVSKRFGVGISTCSEVILEVCARIKFVLMPKTVRWPEAPEASEDVSAKFKAISGIPNVVGVMYTTHIPIIQPVVSVAAYRNRHHTERNQKTSYSITMQGVVDAAGAFTDTCIGWPGSMSDAEVLDKTLLSQRAGRLLAGKWVLVGGASYPLMDWLLVPYTNGNMTWVQHLFNEKLDGLCAVARDAFQRLKARWGCLHKPFEVELEDLPVVIGSCCILHNFCERANEAVDPEIDFQIFDDDMVAENPVRSIAASRARDAIANNLLQYSIAAATGQQSGFHDFNNPNVLGSLDS